MAKTIAPLEATPLNKLPLGNYLYEPKWDGFRCIASKSRGRVELQSKSEKFLTRSFPEIVAELEKLPVSRFILDGELVISSSTGFSFDALLARLHPAQSRIAKLSKETPAHLIVFDLLEDERGHNLRGEPLEKRRGVLDRFFKKVLKHAKPLALSPTFETPQEALDWTRQAGNTIDGVIAKKRDSPYEPGSRHHMFKCKFQRTADCVIGGFRYANASKVVASLLLGLYDDAGLLHYVGHTSSIKRSEQAELTARLLKLKSNESFTGKRPENESRWSPGRTTKWQPIKPKLVIEVEYDQVTSDRFRHGTRLLRFRPDKKPGACLLSQIRTDQAGEMAASRTLRAL